MPETSSSKKKKSGNDHGKELLEILEARFKANMARHKGLEWSKIASRLESQPALLSVLHEMETTGGEPDVVGFDQKTNEFIFFDCAKESPAGRRSLCYDKKSRDARKENKPKSSALEMAEAMKVTLLSEEDYRFLQTLGSFDTKTSSWVRTPESIRSLGGSIFCDFRFGRVFTYHNGAESYYAARGFRGMLRVPEVE